MDASSNGASARPRPAIPTALLAGAIVIALGAVSALVVVLYSRTEGPGEVLRSMARGLDAGDCPGTYDLLDASAQAVTTEDEWCATLEERAATLPPDFTIDHVVTRDQVADVVLRGDGGPGCAWSLRRTGRTWRVLGSDCGAPETGD